MFQFKLRSLVVGVAAFILSMSVGMVSHAEHVRHDARSADGQKMLKIYAKAVAKMKATKDGDPDSSTFQWYTHSVRGATNNPSGWYV